MLPIITAILLAIAIYVFKFYQDVKKYPKGPSPLPFIGNLHQLDCRQPQESMIEFSKKYGSIFTVFLPKPMVVIMDYKHIKEAFMTKGDDFIGRSGVFPDILWQNIENGGVIFSEGEEWKENRRVSLHILRDFGMGKNLMEEKVKDCFADLDLYLKSQKSKDKGLDFRMPIQVCVANIIHQTLFGYHYSYENYHELMEFADILNEEIDEIRASPLAFLAASFPWIAKVPILGWQASGRHFDIVQPAKESIRAKVKKSMEGYSIDQEPSCFAQAYYQRMTKNETIKDVDSHLINVCMDFFLAGMETTSTTLRWAMLFMGAHQDIQERCRKEIVDAIGHDRMPSMSDKPEMPYLNATISEIQRCSNIVPMNVIHRTVRDTAVGGAHIPNDTLVLGQVHSVLKTDEVFTKPDLFVPERFLLDDLKTTRKETSEKVIPFGMGKRQCAGEALARVELFVGLATILQRHRILPPVGKEVDLEPVFASILLPKPQLLCVQEVKV